MSCGRIHFDESTIRADGMPPNAAWSAVCDEHGYRGPPVIAVSRPSTISSTITT